MKEYAAKLKEFLFFVYNWNVGTNLGFQNCFNKAAYNMR